MRLMALLTSRAMQNRPHAEWLDLNDSAIFIMKEGVTVGSSVIYFFNFPDLFPFDVCLCGMEASVIFSL
jgi:hypothetical protein